MTDDLEKKFQATLADTNLQTAVSSATSRFIEKRKTEVAPEVLPEFQELRNQAHEMKRQVLDNLDYYLVQFENNVVDNGGRVIWCEDGADVAGFLAKLAEEKRAKLIVKSKSMTTEEIELNEHLEKKGLEIVETDLGEFIVQLAHSRPYHIVAPALNFTRYDVADLFSRTLGSPHETEPEKQAKIARAVLREKFLSADIGVTGANFLVADSGAIVIATNEGNGRMCTTLPKVHVAIAGIEKIIPRAQDLPVFLKLLGRSATGQQLTVYTSFLSGPRREGEIDGPEEFYVVLLDSGRSRVLADKDKRQSLYCLRCGACLNHCPVYQRIGGHNYPWVYSGPIGAVIGPQFRGLNRDSWLPFASSLCGACAEVCPVKIELPKLLLELRNEISELKLHQAGNRGERFGFRIWAWMMRHPKVYEAIGKFAAWLFRESMPGKWVSDVPAVMNIGPVRQWLNGRDIPPFPERSFRKIWRERVTGRNQ